MDFIQTVLGTLRRQLDRAGVPPEKSEAIVTHIEDFLSHYLGCDKVYLPSGRREAIKRRNEAVLREFNGRNHLEVCRRHGISRRTLYRILKGE